MADNPDPRRDIVLRPDPRGSILGAKELLEQAWKEIAYRRSVEDKTTVAAISLFLAASFGLRDRGEMSSSELWFVGSAYFLILALAYWFIERNHSAYMDSALLIRTLTRRSNYLYLAGSEAPDGGPAVAQASGGFKDLVKRQVGRFRGALSKGISSFARWLFLNEPCGGSFKSVDQERQDLASRFDSWGLRGSSAKSLKDRVWGSAARYAVLATVALGSFLALLNPVHTQLTVAPRTFVVIPGFPHCLFDAGEANRASVTIKCTKGTIRVTSQPSGYSQDQLMSEGQILHLNSRSVTVEAVYQSAQVQIESWK